MAGSPSNRVHRQVHRLFNFGAVGTMSDAQLLDRFVSRRDEVAEAVFEELVIRHGPMVLRVCRGVLHDAHDAEDAFQAVFLVLVNRARSIRRSDSVASWLFGVAQRVATRARRSAARRHKLNDVAAERASETDLRAENDPDWEALHDEIDGLPERLRAPIVLCYLEGLTYAVAAQHLRVSEMAIRGRLARARERLRHRLTRRGVMVPSGLLAAGAATEAQAAIPLTLIHSTSRIALKFVIGNTVAILARGVMNSMLFNRLKVVAAFMFLGVAGSYWAWHALAGAANEQDRGNLGPVGVPPTASVPASKPERRSRRRLRSRIRRPARKVRRGDRRAGQWWPSFLWFSAMWWGQAIPIVFVRSPRGLTASSSSISHPARRRHGRFKRRSVTGRPATGNHGRLSCCPGRSQPTGKTTSYGTEPSGHFTWSAPMGNRSPATFE